MNANGIFEVPDHADQSKVNFVTYRAMACINFQLCMPLEVLSIISSGTFGLGRGLSCF